MLRQVRDKIADVSGMRALGFCVGVAHAQYMARVFTEAGIPARALSGETPTHERKAALDALRSGAIKVLFAADLLNEGVDLPGVDTVLFLRPTESATVFLQQARPRPTSNGDETGADRARLRRPSSQGVPLRPTVPRADWRDR